MNGKIKLISKFFKIFIFFSNKKKFFFFSFRHKQHHDIFDLAIESFINNLSLSDKHDFVSIVNALESKKMI
jgi:hypothetical protein